MFAEFLIPLDQQFDSGFGAIANSFHEAAKTLDVDEYKNGFGLGRSRLPVFYLYRHANELYLKSIITVLHRRLCSRYPDVQKDDFPVINIEGKSKRIFQVHSIRNLFLQFKIYLNNNAPQIMEIAKTDWTAIPKELDESIDLINDADESSTMFRYPMTLDPLNDASKSSFKPIKPEDALAEMHHRSNNKMPGIMILGIKNNDGEIVDTYIHDDKAMLPVLNALKYSAETLLGAQIGIRHELLNGESG